MASDEDTKKDQQPSFLERTGWLPAGSRSPLPSFPFWNQQREEGAPQPPVRPLEVVIEPEPAEGQDSS